MKVLSFFCLGILCFIQYTAAQVSYTANTRANVYNDSFLFGSNMATPVSGWTDETLSEILIGNPAKGIAGAGVTSLRPAMYEWFVNDWGYNVRSSAFKLYQQLGAKNNTIFLNGPSDAHRDKTKYCSSGESKIFANLYEPIWASPGKVNDNNYYAKYIYGLVTTYVSYVKFWEVWNEPDIVDNWQVTQTWSSSNPNPCDLKNMLAPIQRYVRMLRITYEVVKSVSPDAFICVGGLGYPSFLDAVLRNTDNPTDGSVAGDYALKGGAWFDCVSFHIYPMYYIEKTPNSDAAANSIVDYKKQYDDVLNKYGYNGATYPKKEFIITESNIPSKPAGGYIGSDEAQRNYLIKAAVTCQKSSVQGLYVFQVYDTGNDSYGSMGFYQPLTAGPYNATPKSSATAWRTSSTLLKNRRYDQAETDALKLPSSVDGAAFYSETEKNYIYVLWAKLTSSSETGSVTYNFPGTMDVKATSWNTWDNKAGSAAGSSLSLTGSPIFVKVSATVVPVTGVTLNKTATSLVAGATETLTATVAPTTATNKAVTWNSSNTNVVTVNASGVVTAKAASTAVITVITAEGGKTAVCNVTVTAPTTIAVTGVMLNKTATSLLVGASETLSATVLPVNATNKAVTWSSSNANVATVTPTGVVTARAVGTVAITVTTADGGKTATCTVTVTSPPPTVAVTGVTLNKTSTSLPVGKTETLTATVAPANATNKTVTWSSSNTGIATVNAAGLVTAIATGTAVITVRTTDGAKTATCTVTFTAAGTIAVTGVTLNKTATTLAVGKSEKLTATIIPANAVNKTVAWKSSNTAIATVDNTGIVTAVKIGTATITVTTADGNKTAPCQVTVSSVTGIDDKEAPLATLYPNPTYGRFILNFKKQGTYHIYIANMTGSMVLRQTITGNRQEMDISTQPAGLYLLVVDDGKRKSAMKIVKQ